MGGPSSPGGEEARARASLAESLQRRRRTAVAAFGVISAALVALAVASPALGWGPTLALVSSYGAATAVGQLLLRRLELRLRGGIRPQEVEQEYRRAMMVDNLVLILLFILLLLLLRIL